MRDQVSLRFQLHSNMNSMSRLTAVLPILYTPPRSPSPASALPPYTESRRPMSCRSSSFPCCSSPASPSPQTLNTSAVYNSPSSGIDIQISRTTHSPCSSLRPAMHQEDSRVAPFRLHSHLGSAPTWLGSPQILSRDTSTRTLSAPSPPFANSPPRSLH